MAEIVLDTNVLVAFLDDQDALATRADELTTKMRTLGHVPVLLDLVIAEAMSVLARRAAERKANPPDLVAALDQVREWVANDEITFVTHHTARLLPRVLDVIAASSGRLNFNDGLLVLLQQEAIIGDIASFDKDFDEVEGLRRFS